MEIGLVENYKSDHYVVMWFYRKTEGRWLRIRVEKTHPQYRVGILKDLLRSGASLVTLGRGT